MNKNLKKGVTMASIVVYVILFSIITVVLSLIYTNMNDKLFQDRGKAINITSFNKLQYNINSSAVTSTNVTVNNSNIVFSNGDTYVYYKEKGLILLNGGVICTNVEEFNVALSTLNSVKKLNIDVKFSKYLNELEKNIISCVEVI